MAFSLGLSMPEDASSQALANMARGGGSNGVSLGLLPSRPVAMDSPPPLSAEAPEEAAPAGPAMPAQPAPSPVASGGASVPAGVGAPPVAPPAAQQAPLVDFHKNPLGAIGFVLASAAAGMRGDPGGPTRDIQKVQLEQQAQQYKTAELGLNVVEKYSQILANADPSTHADIIKHAQQTFGPALGGADVSGFLTALSDGTKAQNASRVQALKALNVSPQQLQYFSTNPKAAIKFLDDYNDTQAKAQAEPPKSRTVQIGTEKVTQEYDPKTKTWTDVATGPQFEPKAPEHRQITRGSQIVEQDYDPASKTWKDTPDASGPKFKPDNPQENNLAPVQIGFTGPDGEEVQTAASWNRKTGQYTDAASGKPIVNPQNLRVIGNATGGARSQAAVSRVLTNAEDATSGIENLSRLSSSSSRGLFPNLQTTPLSALSRAVTPQEVQDMQATIAGLSRAMGGLATGGLAVDEQVQHSYEALNINTGDSQLTKMRKLGEMRQQTTNALDVQSVSPILTPQQKKKAADLSARIKAAIPWTVQDVQNLEDSGNPKVSLRDLAQQKLNTGGSANGASGFKYLGKE